MNDKPLTILVADKWYFGPDLLDGIRKIAPNARVISPDEFAKDPGVLASADVAFGRLKASNYANAPLLRWHQCPFDGMEWADAPEVRNHPVVLTNARFHAVPVSEQLWGLLLMLVRNLQQSVRHAGQWFRPADSELDVVAGKTLCVLGLGEIGRRCAAIGRAFGMRVIGVSRSGRSVEGAEKVFKQEDLLEALSQAQVVMNLLPLTPKTRGLIGDRELSAMPKGSYFLNAGRGKTVETDALVRALENGQLKGVGLDTVDPEPLPEDHPLWRMPNAVVAAHFGGNWPGYRRSANELFLENLRRFIAGEKLINVVDKQQGY